MKDVKLDLMAQAVHLAAPLVGAVAGKLTFPADPAMQDATVRQLNLYAYELVQVFYNALKLAYEDNSADKWPDPKGADSTKPVAPSTPSTPIPSPGANLSGAAQIAGAVSAVAGAAANAFKS